MTFSQTGLVLISTICFLSFGWAIGFHFDKPPDGTNRRMWALSLCGVIFFVLQVYFIITGTAPDLPTVGSVVLRFALAIFLFVISLTLFWWTVATTRRRRFGLAFATDSGDATTTAPDLVVTGPYRFVRHPFYLSYLIFWVAGVSATGHIWMGVSVAVMFGFYLTAANSEERRILSGPLGSEYSAYSKRSGMFLPRLSAIFGQSDRQIREVVHSRRDG